MGTKKVKLLRVIFHLPDDISLLSVKLPNNLITFASIFPLNAYDNDVLAIRRPSTKDWLGGNAWSVDFGHPLYQFTAWFLWELEAWIFLGLWAVWVRFHYDTLSSIWCSVVYRVFQMMCPATSHGDHTSVFSFEASIIMTVVPPSRILKHCIVGFDTWSSTSYAIWSIDNLAWWAAKQECNGISQLKNLSFHLKFCFNIYKSLWNFPL